MADLLASREFIILRLFVYVCTACGRRLLKTHYRVAESMSCRTCGGRMILRGYQRKEMEIEKQ